MISGLIERARLLLYPGGDYFLNSFTYYVSVLLQLSEVHISKMTVFLFCENAFCVTVKANIFISRICTGKINLWYRYKVCRLYSQSFLGEIYIEILKMHKNFIFIVLCFQFCVIFIKLRIIIQWH